MKGASGQDSDQCHSEDEGSGLRMEEGGASSGANGHSNKVVLDDRTNDPRNGQDASRTSA
jgi:hypothetical protein